MLGFFFYYFSNNSDFSIVSEIVDSALIDEQQSYLDVCSVFVSILQASGLDSRDKKAAIIDYIAAGIKTVRFSNLNEIFTSKCEEKRKTMLLSILAIKNDS